MQISQVKFSWCYKVTKLEPNKYLLTLVPGKYAENWILSKGATVQNGKEICIIKFE